MKNTNDDGNNNNNNNNNNTNFFYPLLAEYINKTQIDGIIVINDATTEIIKIKKNITVDLKFNKNKNYFTDDAHNVYLIKNIKPNQASK